MVRWCLRGFPKRRHLISGQIAASSEIRHIVSLWSLGPISSRIPSCYLIVCFYVVSLYPNQSC